MTYLFNFFFSNKTLLATIIGYTICNSYEKGQYSRAFNISFRLFKQQESWHICSINAMVDVKREKPQRQSKPARKARSILERPSHWTKSKY